MARWHVPPFTVEYRWFGRWLTPRWLDRPQFRQRDYRVDGFWLRAYDRLSDFCRRWAVHMIDAS